MPNVRVALAHDWLVGARGGEWVLDRLARLFGPTDLYTLVDGGDPITAAIDRCRTVTSPLQRFPGARGGWRRHYLPLMPWAVRQLEVEPCDLLISTSSAVMKSIRPPEGVPHLCYCHAPARYLWEQGRDYRIGAGGRTRGVGLRLLRRPFQRWDRATAAGVTRFLANSRHTARRIERCFGRDAAVVYPPVRTGLFTADPDTPREPWCLVVAALEPYKRTDLVIAAANQGRWPLVVVGDGSQRSALARQAGPTVRFLGRIPGAALRDRYRRAAALICPQQEDFGITALEAQACGCPVVAYRAGGALETVTEQTGIFFDDQTVESLQAAVDGLATASIDSGACRANALRFAPEVFDAAILHHALELLQEQRAAASSGACHALRG